MHPSEVLFDEIQPPVALPVCDHYAGSEKLMRKSMALQHQLGPVFDITFDCEDGAAAGNERNHAMLIATLIASEENRFGRIGARVHDLGSAFFESDCAEICRLSTRRPAYVVVPKVHGVADVEHAISIINQYKGPDSTAPIPVHVLVETHGALAEVEKIAALPQVECLSFGIMDFVSDHLGAIPAEAMHSPLQFTHPLIVHAKTRIAAACHRFGKTPSHNVTTEIRDVSTVRSDARQATFYFGYTRMWSIHPDQIMPIIDEFAPSSSDVEDAAAILLSAAKSEWGPIQFKGKLHDRASYRYYWNVLKRAKVGGRSFPPEAAQLL